MAEQIKKVGFGVGTDDVKVGNSLKFGGNFGNTRMTKFEFNPNSGKDGAPMEALDIVFTIENVDKSYRMFPPSSESKVYSKEKGKTKEVLEVGTDAWKIGFNELMEDFNDRVTHIMKCFVDEDTLKKALSVEIPNFKAFCLILTKLLPTDYKSKLLDIFLQWQWRITGTNDKTYLEIPTKLKYGKFLVPAETPVGEWKEDRKDGLHYIDDNGNRHTFGRNNWFMESEYANQQKDKTSEEIMETATEAASDSEAADSNNTGW